MSELIKVARTDQLTHRYLRRGRDSTAEDLGQFVEAWTARADAAEGT